MTFEIKITAPPERDAIIAKKVAGSSKTQDFHEFRNRKSELKVIEVPIDLPIYRMENFRTFTDQIEYLDKEKKAADFFRRGQESESAQQAQHELLAALAEKGRADSVVPIFEVLEKRGQQQPLLMSANGVIVNGNRRLAAMRELYAIDANKYRSFSHVDVMVLPEDATPDEIVDIEANLQATPETKLDYDWIGEAQLIRRLLQMHDAKSVGKQLNRSERDVRLQVQKLAEADLYLKDWVGDEARYSKVKDANQLFGDLVKLIADKPESGKSASRVIAWTILDNKTKVDGRIYNFNPAIGKLAEDVLERTSETLGFPVQDDDNNTQDAEDDDSFAFDLGDEAEPEASRFSAVISALSRRDDNEDVVDALIDAAETSIEIDKEKRLGGAALKSLTQAHAKMASIDLGKAEASTHSGIKKQLAAIKKIIERFEKHLDDSSGSS